MYIKGLVEHLLEQDGRLFLIEIKRMMAPLKKVFELIVKSPWSGGPARCCAWPKVWELLTRTT